MRVTLLLSGLIILFAACEESRTACLDFYAENYDAGAVDPCDSCCSYPSFSFNTNLVFDTFSFAYNRYQNLPSGDSIAIQSFELGILDIRFQNQDSIYYINDLANPEATQLDNSILYNSKSSALQLGETSFSDDITSVVFKLGSALVDLPDFDGLVTGSNWSLIRDSLYIDSIPAFNTFNVTYLLNDSIPYNISSTKVIGELDFDIIKFVPPGQDWSLNMTWDFYALLANINSTMTQDEIRTIFEDNLSSFIKFE